MLGIAKNTNKGFELEEAGRFNEYCRKAVAEGLACDLLIIDGKRADRKKLSCKSSGSIFAEPIVVLSCKDFAAVLYTRHFAKRFVEGTCCAQFW